MNAEAFTPAQVGIRMTEAAASHVRKQLARRPDYAGVRLAIKQSGCSGYKYDTDWVETPADDDEAFVVADGVTVFVSRKHLPVVNGTEIDYVTQGLNSLFIYRNPNATAECGCGESFSIS
ncbi:MAG: iron-sulfur cluster assembly accessory protein [Gammaproteobacteria bacterium]|nr:iron-sulfur cluster assembly accessory protein [Gammaproteobacteria bacterium]